MKTIRLACAILSSMAVGSFAAQAQTTPPACSPAILKGTHALVLTGRNVSASTALSAALQSTGSATFDGVGAVSFSLTANTNLAQGVADAYSGTYTLQSDCVGSLSLTTGDTANFTLIAFNKGAGFTITGQDASYALTGTGAAQPAACLTSTLSGNYAFSGNGYALNGTAITGVNSISGLLQFDGKGDITGNWSVATNGVATPDTVTGKYSVTSACLASGTMTDASGVSFPFSLTMTSLTGADFTADLASPAVQFNVSGHSTFSNPGQAVVSAASGLAGSTPPGSIFALYGSGLTTSSNQANTLPLPTTLAGATVTINGEAAPLFYASATQINAQMPLDIPPGLATVVVTTTAGSSNTAAVTVPATATPGIFLIGGTTDRAVVQNANFSVNSSTAPAHVGDTVVGYFTGGGPVTPYATLTTGAASPDGPSPITEAPVAVAVAGVQAKVNYIGLTPTLVGVYQVNFVIPQVAAGDRTMTISIAGTTSPGELITVAE